MDELETKISQFDQYKDNLSFKCSKIIHDISMSAIALHEIGHEKLASECIDIIETFVQSNKKRIGF